MRIHNDHDLRIAYELLRILEQAGTNYLDRVSQMKRDIRAYTNKPMSDNRIVRDDGDAGVFLERLPDYLDGKSLEYVTDWFEDVRCIQRPYSAYDCTGALFTVWYKLFRRHGHWMAYHRVAVDC